MKSLHMRTIIWAVAVLLAVLSACSSQPQKDSGHSAQTHQEKTVKQSRSKDSSGSNEVSSMNRTGIHVVADPDSTLVLINKYFKLPDHYTPEQLVYADIPFISEQKSEKMKMRPEAARAVETMFAAAKKNGIRLAGVSAYRSYQSQVRLFNYYVEKDGEKAALTYSARPGTSEHETGLAIDVSGTDGKYAASDAFAGTPEAAWLERHAPDYGFIIRYPKGKEEITGYKYEAWHLRYVGTQAAQTIKKKGQTLEEYLGDIPVSN